MIAISLAWVVVGVVPVDDGWVLPPWLETISSGDDGAAPVTSRTVTAMAEVDADVPPTVTVID